MQPALPQWQGRHMLSLHSLVIDGDIMKKLVGILVLMAAGSSVAAQQGVAGPTREAAIAYWTSGYAGAELAGVGCVTPQLPDEAALSGAQRKAVKAIRTWKECHRSLMGALAPEAAHQYIPADLHATMTPAEREAATRHVAAVHAKLADALQADAAKAMAAQQAWHQEVQRYIDDYRDRVVYASRER